MPQNHYQCSKCANAWSFIGPYKSAACPECGNDCKPGIPRNVEAPAVMETVDPQYATKWRENFKERATRRNAFYSKKTAKERAHEHNEDPKKHGITDDDPKPV
jgi:predicted nucleic acid-binding Zn ribbon protein